MYDSSLTGSVLIRLAGLAALVRAGFALAFGLVGALLGIFFVVSVGTAVSALSSRSSDPGSQVPLGLILGGGAGVALGLGLAHLVVVGIEWAQQVLGALHVIAIGQNAASPQAASPASDEESRLIEDTAARPQDPTAHAALGTYYRQQGRFADAQRAYDRALELNPTSASIHNNIGNLKRAQGDLGDAVEAYHEAIRIDPNAVIPRFNLGLAEMDQHHTPEAIAAFQAVIDLEPSHIQAKDLLARLRRR